MKIDIFDTTVPDYSILDKKSLMESLGYGKLFKTPISERWGSRFV